MTSAVYGPVSSWRLGRSLGIDLLSTNKKTCSFDCVYCQLGAGQPAAERSEFVSLDELAACLEGVRGVPADYATFSGMGEPTLAENLGQAIQLTRSILHLPVAVLTNSSLMSREDVRHELAQADVVVAKLDAPTEELFRQISRPCIGPSLVEILDAISEFRRSFSGKLALQMMFLEANKECAAEMAGMAEDLLADEVQINTPLRPCPVEPLSRQEIAAISREFSGFKEVVTVYEATRPDVAPLHREETLRRRPQL
jgi:wyosine [tRNA(Phe)-imidazoG37] synthetase (radical SAM superfamily)